MVFKTPVTINGTPYKTDDPVPSHFPAEHIKAMQERGWIGDKPAKSKTTKPKSANTQGAQS